VFAFVLPMTRDGAGPAPASADPAGAATGGPQADATLVLPVGVQAPSSAGASRGAGGAGPPAAGATTQPDPDGITTPGTVLVDGPDGVRPLAGATVYTSDGRVARTDATGRFQLPGLAPADGTWVAAAPGHITSAVTGLPAPPTLHLREQATTRAQPALGAPETLDLRGEVRDASGRPAPNVLVAVGGAELVAGIPVRTDAQGRWTSRVVVAGGRLGAATLLAVDMDGAGLGVAHGLVASAASADMGVLTLVPTTLAATLELDAGAVELPTQIDIRAVADHGVSLPLFGPGGVRRVARLAGLRFALEVTAQDPSGELRSEIRRPELAFDWRQATATWREALLPLPGLVEPLTDIFPGQEVAWLPVPGASGYLMEVQGVEAVPELPWEGFTTDTRLPFLWRGESWPRGAYYVTLRALDAPGLSTRALAAIGARRLRSWQSSAGWRASFRRVQVQR
jgi:hypothetical protein